MEFEIVEAESQPFVYVTRSSGMDSGEIGTIMEEAFGAIGAFIGRNAIAPAGAPIAVYRDWDGTTMKIDVGFPVPGSAAQSSNEMVHVGQTPSGKALKAIHHGPYTDLKQSYEAMERYIDKSGLEAKGIAWEVYLTDPGKTAENDLVTEIYMLLG